jgi:xyloglucan-specific exo-beta-1,4-glucanase
MKKITLITMQCFLATAFLFAQNSWQNISTKGMGYVDGLIVHPNTNTKFIRTDVGGLFYFNATTQNWVALTDKLATSVNTGISAVEAFAVDKNSSGANQKMYALCGLDNRSFLIATNNNGSTWTVNQGWNGNIKADGNGTWRQSGEKILIDPNNSDIIYTGTRFDGLFKTTNAAVQWNNVSSFAPRGGAGGTSKNGGISFVVADPNSTTTVNGQTATKNIYVGLIDGGIYRSNDGGLNWCYLAGGFDTTAQNPVRAVWSNNELIVATQLDAANSFEGGELWVFKPDANGANCGGAWINKTPGIASNFACPVIRKYMYNTIAVKPNDPNTVYLVPRFGTPRFIIYTTNFSATAPNWKLLTYDNPEYYTGACAPLVQRSVLQTPPSWLATDGYDWVGNAAFDINNPNELWITSGNGVMKVEDINANPAIISSVNTMKDLEILCVNDVASPPAPNTTPLVTAAMDVFGLRYNDLTTGNVNKLDPTLGLGAGISMDYSFNNPLHMVIVGQFYENPENENRELKSADGGLSWTPIYSAGNNCTAAPWGGNIAISSANPNNIIWVPSDQSTVTGCATPVRNFPIYTTNGGNSWNNCNNINFPDGNFPFKQRSVFGIGKMLESDKVNGNKFYLYAMPGNTFVPQLWRTTDGGANWIKISENVLPISGEVELKANPFVEDDIWFSPFNSYIRNVDPDPDKRKLYHSTNGGSSWTTLSSIDEVYKFGFGAKVNGSSNPQLIVHGTKNGIESIYISNDLGVTFTDVGTVGLPVGITANLVGDMKVPGRIYASTGCRGVFLLNTQSVTLSSVVTLFTGQQTSVGNRLVWTVGGSVSNLLLEQSTDGRNFASLHQSRQLNSQYLHVTNAALVYYRLKLQYPDGNVVYSNIIRMGGKEQSLLLYPNPAKDNITLQTNDLALIGKVANIINTNGQKVQQVLVSSNFTNIGIERLPAGQYYLQTANGNMLRFTKQ